MRHERPHGWSFYPKATQGPGRVSIQDTVHTAQVNKKDMRARKLSGEAQGVQKSCHKAVCLLVSTVELTRVPSI